MGPAPPGPTAPRDLRGITEMLGGMASAAQTNAPCVAYCCLPIAAAVLCNEPADGMVLTVRLALTRSYRRAVGKVAVARYKAWGWRT